MKLGAQFYTLRKRATNPEDLRTCFEAMHKIGYDNAQMSGICTIEPERLRDYSEEFNLPITCTHTPLPRLLNETDKVIAEHKIYGCPVVGLGMMPKEYHGSMEAAKDFFKQLETPMKKIRDAGLVFAYHNHAFEFNDFGGTNVYEYLLEELPELNFIPDVYWFTYAGQDPLALIRRIGKERCANVHFKDMRTAPQGPICPCGEGVIDFKPIITLCDELGIPNALVEQDNAPDLGDEFAQIKVSFDNLKPLF